MVVIGNSGGEGSSICECPPSTLSRVNVSSVNLLQAAVCDFSGHSNCIGTGVSPIDF